jgi:Uri superfamily endonuclease
MSDDYEPLRSVTIVGDESWGGIYLLRLRIERETVVQFGRFQQGRSVIVPAGECLYLGSAMRGLGARLLRHASRTDANKPQPLRVEMAALFAAAGLVKGKRLSVASTGAVGAARPFPPKRLHWHIDYLLEQPAVELTHVIALRTGVKLETAVADKLAQDPAVFIFAPGLGAQDDPGRTHLLGIRADEGWWRQRPSQLLLLNQAVQSAHKG